MNGLLLRQILDKMLKGEVSKSARVQVALPDGKFYDIKGIQLMENKLLGVRETHRIVLVIDAERWRMGNVVNKLGEFKIR